jgi:LysM repeat protein
VQETRSSTPALATTSKAAATPANADAPCRPTEEVRQAARQRASSVAAVQAQTLHQRAATREPVWPLTVRAGDTLSSIAARYPRPDGTVRSWQELVDHNPQLVARPDRILPGEVVGIPRSWVTSAKTPDARSKESPRTSPERPHVVAAPPRSLPPPPTPPPTPTPTATTVAAPVEQTPRRVDAAAAEAPTVAPSRGRTAAQDALFADILARGPVQAHPGNTYEQAIAGHTTAAGLQRFVDGALDTLARRQHDFQARTTWTRNIRVALGRAAELGVQLH